MHKSIRIAEAPIEFINITPLNPLISKCQIKVCYVGDEPNRNKSIITKDVAKQIANSLPGSPIVGYYNETKEDFEEHNRFISISNGKFVIKDETRPYGFVDLNAKVWFAKYLDDDTVEREYLMTEGYLWTGQYKECQRVFDLGNNHSMELDDKIIDGHWTKDDNGKPKFFIINEAIISKLCILGEENEPCFEGSNITTPTIQFSFDDGFKEQLFSMMNELKDLINKGGKKVFTRYSVVIGDALWTALYSHVKATYATYGIESVCEDDGKLFAILTADEKYYRLDFSVENSEYVFAAELSDIEDYTPGEEPQFSAADIEAYENSQNSTENLGETGKDNNDENHNNSEDNTSNPEEPEAKATYSLDQIPEYVELLTKYNALEAIANALTADKANLESQVATLSAFKAQIEKKEKENMIASFYMLSDDDKKDVIDNIDTYSLDDIEAKLSILCVRKKVSFELDEDDKNKNEPTTYGLNGSSEDEDATTPAWVKAAMKVAQTMN